MFRYNFDKICNDKVWAGAYVSPHEYDDPFKAREYLALLYTPGYRYKLNSQITLDTLPDPCKSNEGEGKIRRVWAAFGEPGGGFECVLSEGVKFTDETRFSFGPVPGEYTFVHEPLHILTEEKAKALLNKYFKYASEDGRIGSLIDEGEPQEGELATKEAGVVYHFRIRKTQKLQLEYTLSFAARKRGRSYCEAFGFWGMVWFDINNDPVSIPSNDCSKEGWRILLPVIVDKIEGLTISDFCPNNLSDEVMNLLIKRLLDVHRNLADLVELFDHCWHRFACIEEFCYYLRRYLNGCPHYLKIIHIPKL